MAGSLGHMSSLALTPWKTYFRLDRYVCEDTRRDKGEPTFLTAHAMQNGARARAAEQTSGEKVPALALTELRNCIYGAGDRQPGSEERESCLQERLGFQSTLMMI